jgi:AraC family transcriptional regulator
MRSDSARAAFDPMVRSIFRGGQVSIGEFHCSPRSSAWERENSVGPSHRVVFPGTSVVITPEGGQSIVANPNHVIFYNPGQSYRRTLLSERGDHCVFMVPTPELLRDVAAEADPSMLDGGDVRFGFTHGPIDAGGYVRQRLVIRHLSEATESDALYVEETMTQVLFDAVVAAAKLRSGSRRTQRGPTALAHGEIVEDTKRILSGAMADKLSLSDIAARVHASPFHLARMFRASTGFSIHEYRNQLRLRYALDRVCEQGTDLSSIAVELGFGSHSHFTDSFRRVFGITPSKVRRTVRGGDIREMHLLLERPPRPFM